MELADLVVINKADIDAAAATRAQALITSSLRLLGMHGNPEQMHHDAAVWLQDPQPKGCAETARVK